MVCLGLESEAAGWKGQTNPLSYGGNPNTFTCWVESSETGSQPNIETSPYL